MPVVQFEMLPSMYDRRAGGDDGNLTFTAALTPQDDGPRFQMEYDIADFTPDPRYC